MNSRAESMWLASVAVIALGVTASQANAEDESELPLEGHTETLSFSTDEGSWLSLDIAPDGATIVFDLLGDLYTLPIAGGEATRITSGLGFDSQPRFSPDGKWIAFVSDRNGSNNLWIAERDGSGAKMLSDEKQWGIISPEWAPDSQYVLVTRTALQPEMTMFHIDGGSGVTLKGPGEEDEGKFWGVGAVFSPDGRHVYFSQGVDSNGPVKEFPATQISRFDRTTGAIDQLTRAEGGAVRPLLSPDGTLLVYGTRSEAQTGLRVRNLINGSDRWLAYPVQRDAQENFRPPSRDLLPGYAFTPDGRAVMYNANGGIYRVDIESGEMQQVAFTAEIELDVGPDLTAPYEVAQGPLTATIVQDPQLSPDGENIVASVLAHLHVMDADGNEAPARLTEADTWEFKPVWSSDGRWIAYVSWSMNDGGHVWRMRSDGRGRPQRLTDVAAFYTDLSYAPDGDTLIALRGNEYMRHQTFSEFTGLGVPLDIVSLPADGGPVQVIAAARGGRNPHFTNEPGRLFLYDEKGLYSIQLDGSDRRSELVVTGPRGNRRDKEPPQAEMVKMSPRGKHALAFINKQVWLLVVTRVGDGPVTVDSAKPVLPMTRLTDIGADFFGWTSNGESIYWAIGSTVFFRSLDSVEWPAKNVEKDTDETEEDFVVQDEIAAVTPVAFSVTVPRATPSGSLLLRGASVIPMSGDTTSSMSQVRANQDILVTGNRIVAIGQSGSLDVPPGAATVDVSGKFVVPGFIDTHAHWEFRTGDVLEPQNWSLAVNLAYGVTAGLDVQTAYKDYLAYRDFIETGQSVGQRAFMTARGIFGNNDFQSYEATRAYLRRYAEHYRTPNIKSYVVGNRKQRQWIVLAAKDLGLMPTTEGAGDQKLNLTHAIDGMHGNEHTLPDLPLFNDVVQLFARTKTAYTPTLIVQYNAESAREYFFTRTEVHDDPKLRRFYPHNRLDELTQRRPGWQRDSEFNFRQAAADAVKIQRAGGLVGVGGHAELQGLGYHWEMWAYELGGMSPAEILRAATIDAARIVGINQDLGSIEVGKLADMVILDASPLQNIRNTASIYRVVQNGRLYNGDTLDQLWPEEVSLEPFWWWSEDDPRFSTAPVMESGAAN